MSWGSIILTGDLLAMMWCLWAFHCNKKTEAYLRTYADERGNVRPEILRAGGFNSTFHCYTNTFLRFQTFRRPKV